MESQGEQGNVILSQACKGEGQGTALLPLMPALTTCMKQVLALHYLSAPVIFP